MRANTRGSGAAANLTRKVVALGASASGRQTVALEGGQIWELEDAADPLLTDGDTVTITRAAFGSFRLTTSQGRPHRVRRLQ